MVEILRSIVAGIQSNEYDNEELVRVGIVCRILLESGWDIWNPREVKYEFKTTPEEDINRVDIALVNLLDNTPYVFIEVKTLNSLNSNTLARTENQLRNYNKNNTAIFSVITDGNTWHFYYAYTSGKFSEKRFKTFSMLESIDLSSIATMFSELLSKDSITNNTTREIAESYLQSTKEQQQIESVLPKAQQALVEPPFPDLVTAISSELIKQGNSISVDTIKEYLTSKRHTSQVRGHAPSPSTIVKTSDQVHIGSPMSLSHSTSSYRLKLKPTKLNATGLLHSNGEFKVFAGSEASLFEKSSLSPNAKEYRNKLLRSGDLERRGDRFVFRNDCVFPSLNIASASIVGYSINAPHNWIDENGQNLNDLRKLE